MTQPYTLAQIIAASQVGVLSVAVASSAGYLRQGGLIRIKEAYLFSPYTVLGGIVGSLLLLTLDAKVTATVFALPGFGTTTLVEMGVFLAIIAVCILYAARKGVLTWR